MGISKFDFIEGVEKVKSFFPKLSVSDKQGDAWYSKFKHYSLQDWNAGIDFLINNHGGGSIEFNDFLRALRAAPKSDSYQNWKEIEDSIDGFAVDSDKKKQLAKECILGLVYIVGQFRARKLSVTERDRELNNIKELWLREYPKLPGYMGKAQIRYMVNNKDAASLKRIGFIK